MLTILICKSGDAAGQQRSCIITGSTALRTLIENTYNAPLIADVLENMTTVLKYVVTFLIDVILMFNLHQKPEDEFV